MKPRNYYFQVWFLILICGIVQIKAYECQFQQSFEEAFHSSEAVFFAKSIEEKTVTSSTKGGSNINYLEVRFEVEKSWKLVDKQSVWVRIPARRTDNCGYKGINLKYLVYANQMNEILFISSSSRTMFVEEAGKDLEKLGKESLEISQGEFRLIGFQVWIISTFVSMILLILLFLYLVKKRPVSRF